MQTTKRKSRKRITIGHFAVHLVGHKHSILYRGTMGICLMIAGVILAGTAGASEHEPIKVVGDTVGYGLHGLGLLPFVEYMLASVKDTK